MYGLVASSSFSSSSSQGGAGELPASSSSSQPEAPALSAESVQAAKEELSKMSEDEKLALLLSVSATAFMSHFQLPPCIGSSAALISSRQGRPRRRRGAPTARRRATIIDITPAHAPPRPHLLALARPLALSLGLGLGLDRVQKRVRQNAGREVN